MKNQKTFSTLVRILCGAVAWNLTSTLAVAHDDDGRDAAPVPGLVRDAMPKDFTPGYLAERVGIAQRAGVLFGIPVEDRTGKKVGNLEDFVVDLNSARVFCALVEAGDSSKDFSRKTVEIPGRAFYSADEREALLDKEARLDTAPVTTSADMPSVVKGLPAAYKYFDQKESWDPTSVVRAQRCTDLMGQPVSNAAGESLGHVANVVIDLPTSRVLFVIVSLAGTRTDFYAVPPKAFQVAADNKGLLLNADRAKVASLAHSDGFFWSNMADLNWDLAAYRNFGQQADFDPSLPNTSQDPTRENVRTKAEPLPLKSDREVQQSVIDAMMRDNVNNAAIYNRVLVSASHGQVTLSGVVKNEKDRAKLVGIASSAVGAANVHDNLQVK